MNNLSQRKERYMRDGLPVRLGGLAANFARIKSISRNVENGKAAFGIFEESKYFIEWTVVDASFDLSAELAAIQLQIAVWQLKWQRIWPSEPLRRVLTATTDKWTTRIINHSGLLDEH